jgi:acyl-CoA dehydrogenase
MRVSWEKRYITLGPVATLLGLAFKLSDPDHLLGDEEDLGITLALVPTNTPGISIGRRHFPGKQAFQNGPNSGNDVFVPMDWVIGGRDGAGQGWGMLMDCLAAGRSISLPSIATAGAKFCARVTGAYARVRKQFNVPVGKFEGVEEALTRIAANAYVLDAARQITAAVVDRGEKPSVLSAICKYHFTERMRETVNDAMDVHGGRGICDGPNNYLSHGYQGLPITITVEGANILTRSLIIFGQGAIRCHPYLLKEMQAAHNPDKAQGLVEFDQALWGHIGFFLGNVGRALWHNLSGGRFAAAPAVPMTASYYRQLSRASASFALAADMALLLLGGELKRQEKLSGRFGDILSEMYLMSCVLKRFEDDGRPQQDLPLVDWSCQTGLYSIQQRFEEIVNNFPSRLLGWLLGRIVFPFGRRYKKPSDRLGHQCAALLLEPSGARDRLTAGIFLNRDPDDLTGCLEYALEKVLAAEVVEEKLEKSGCQGSLREAVQAGLINDRDAQLIMESEKATRRAIMVDDFDPEELTAGARIWPDKTPTMARAV